MFRTNGKKGHSKRNDFRHCYGILLGSDILKVTSSQLCSKFLVNNYQVHWRYAIVIYGHGSTHMLNRSSKLRQAWNKNRWKCLEKDQLHKKSKGAVRRTKYTPKYTTFHLLKKVTTEYTNELIVNKFWQKKKIKISDIYKNKNIKIFNIDEIHVNKILISKKEP